MENAFFEPDLSKILDDVNTIAVVGMSPKPDRPSHMVASYLIEMGYNVIPVNPGQSVIMGLKCYPDLISVPEKVDLVDVFRKPKDVSSIVKDAVLIGVRTVWLQVGIINIDAYGYAVQHGLNMVMDKCLKIEHMQLNKKG